MKTFTTVICLIAFSCFFAFSQQTPTTEQSSQEESTEQIILNPYSKKNYSKWSLMVEGGLNFFQGDVSPDVKQVFESPINFTLGGTVEYTINPAFSMGVSYMFSKTASHDNSGEFKSTIHHVYPFFGFNFLKYFFFETSKRWNLWTTAGLGVMHYDSHLTYVYRTNLVTEQEWFNPDKNDLGLSNINRWGGVIPVGMELSFNITRHLALSLKANHLIYTRDDVEGGIKLYEPDKYGRKKYGYVGSSNDQLTNLTLGVRWNIHTGGKEHMRNITWSPLSVRQENKRIDEIAQKLDSIQNHVNSIVPVIINNHTTECDEEPVSIYFDFDKYSFTKRSLVIISKVAEKMLQNESLTLEVRGYTDVKGTTNYNKTLSQRRADAVKNELVKKWGISASRITANGDGVMPSPDESYHHVSRRCDFIFTDTSADEDEE